MLEIPRRFRIIRKLGEGSQKRVWLALDRDSGTKVAISEVPRREDDPLLPERLSHSLQVQLTGEPHHVAPIHELIERSQGTLLVGRYFPTGSLASFLADRGDAQLAFADVSRIAAQVCRALQWAHAHDVVHCDLSTANLLMNPDGDVFLADFGLARVAGATARDDVVGGHLATMAPERLERGLVDARSDLYSLGCLLYQLLTGEAPFDEANAGEQLRRHALAPPAPPSSRRANLPPWLDDLTMRLLAKDPATRPASASDVLITLESAMGPGALSDGGARTGTKLVDREREVDALARVLDEARAGHSSVVLLLAEAGAGKSRVLDELLELARAEGVLTLVGRACEDAQLPFEPLAQATRPLGARLGSVPESAARTLRRLLAPPLRDDAPSAVGAVERGRNPIERAWTQAMREWVRETPLLLVIDDLHWADGGTLHLIESVATAIAEGVADLPGFALVIASRPVVPSHPAHATIAALTRESGCATLDLPSLSEDGIARLISSQGHPNPTNDLIQYVIENSQGNALFASTLVRHLHERGELRSEGPATSLARPPEVTDLPESITSAILRRLTSLPRMDQLLFSEAACIGMRFTGDELESVCDPAMREASQAASIGRGLQAEIVVEEGEDLVFSHSLVRHVLRQLRSQEEQNATHARIARRLLASGGASSETVFRIAHHILQAQDQFADDEAIRWSTAAGNLAFERCAWRDAAGLYEAALCVATRNGERSTSELAALHRSAGQSRCYGYEVDSSLAHFDEAVRGFREVDDRDEVARTLIEQYLALAQFKKLPPGDSSQIEPLECATKELSGEDRVLEARCLAVISEAHWLAGNSRQASATSARAVALAAELEQAALCGETLIRRALAQFSNLEVGEALSSLRSALAYGERSDASMVVEEALSRIPISLIAMGRLAEARTAACAAFEANDVVQLPGEAALTHALLVTIAALEGDHDEAERRALTALQLGQRAPYPWPAAVFIPSLAYSRSVRGDWSGAVEAIEALSTPGVIFESGAEWAASVARYRAWISMQSGDGRPSRDDVALADWERPADPQAYDFAIVPGLCCRVELCCELGLDFEDWIERALEAAERNGIVVAAGWPFLVPRARGLIALAQRRPDEALEHFERARDLAEGMGSSFEAARARLECGNARAHIGGRISLERAAAEVERALPGLQHCGAGRLLQRAERLLEYLSDRRS